MEVLRLGGERDASLDRGEMTTTFSLKASSVLRARSAMTKRERQQRPSNDQEEGRSSTVESRAEEAQNIRTRLTPAPMSIGANSLDENANMSTTFTVASDGTY